MALEAGVATAINGAYDSAAARDASYAVKFDYRRIGTGSSRRKVYVWVDYDPCQQRDAPGEIWIRVFPNPGP